MLDSNPAAIKCIQENLELLKVENACLLNRDARDYLQQEQPSPFDIVFLDPPFNQQLLEPFIHLLESRPWLKKGSLIYIEAEKQLKLPLLPENWLLLKQKKTGQLAYNLSEVTK